MPYDSTVPQSGQTLGNTHTPIQSNFSIITTAQSVNHVAFDNADQGKHKFLQMPEQASAPGTAVNEGGLYTKQSSVTPQSSQLFYRNENNGTEVQLTGLGGVTPVIVTGSRLISGSSNQAIYGPLPQNVYGYIIMWKSTSTFGTQMGTFFTNTTNANGYSMRVVKNGSSSDNPVELINDPNTGDLTLYAKEGSFGSFTMTWRLHYWAQ